MKTKPKPKRKAAPQVSWRQMLEAEQKRARDLESSVVDLCEKLRVANAEIETGKRRLVSSDVSLRELQKVTRQYADARDALKQASDRRRTAVQEVIANGTHVNGLVWVRADFILKAMATT